MKKGIKKNPRRLAFVAPADALNPSVGYWGEGLEMEGMTPVLQGMGWEVSILTEKSPLPDAREFDLVFHHIDWLPSYRGKKTWLYFQDFQGPNGEPARIKERLKVNRKKFDKILTPSKALVRSNSDLYYFPVGPWHNPPVVDPKAPILYDGVFVGSYHLRPESYYMQYLLPFCHTFNIAVFGHARWQESIFQKEYRGLIHRDDLDRVLRQVRFIIGLGSETHERLGFVTNRLYESAKIGVPVFTDLSYETLGQLGIFCNHLIHFDPNIHTPFREWVFKMMIDHRPLLPMNRIRKDIDQFWGFKARAWFLDTLFKSNKIRPGRAVEIPHLMKGY